MYIGNQKILIFIQILFIGFDLFVNVCIDQIAKDFTIQLGTFYFTRLILSEYRGGPHMVAIIIMTGT